MKTSRLVLAPAVAVALTGLAGAPAFAATESTASVPQQPLCAQGDQQSSSDSEADSSVPEESDPQATLAHAQVTRADIANSKKGIGFSGTGFTADEKATVTVIGTDGTDYTPPKKLTVDEKGQVSGTYFFTATEDAQVPVGEYSLYLTDLKSEKKSSKVTFEVVASDSDVDDSDPTGDNCESATGPIKDPSETDEPSETKTDEPSTEAPEPSETKTDEPSTKAPEPSETKTDEPTTKAPEPTETDKTDEAPAQAPTETDEAESDEPTSEAPKPTETDGDESSAAPKDEKSEDKESESTGPASPGTEEKEAPAAAKQSLSIDPTEISSEDFLDKGIKLGVSGAQPGEKVTITVEHAQGKVDRYTMTKQADSEGKATFGVQAKVKAVLGTYNVRAQAESFDEPQGGSFTVLTNGTAVDEGGSDSGAAGSDLPRTGAEMTGLALGVGLLAVGAAAVIITRRRMNASDDPAEF